ncbi:MAG: DUF4250 domain-containing protein, partial [Bacteroidales bacterium]
MDQLPKDVNMLFSFINMKLRDSYSSLDALCDDLNIDPKDLIEKLASGGF